MQTYYVPRKKICGQSNDSTSLSPAPHCTCNPPAHLVLLSKTTQSVASPHASAKAQTAFTWLSAMASFKNKLY